MMGEITNFFIFILFNNLNKPFSQSIVVLPFEDIKFEKNSTINKDFLNLSYYLHSDKSHVCCFYRKIFKLDIEKW